MPLTAFPDPATDLERYEVGGAVRDALLGLPVHDRDWVVVGATPERMVELGFRPVGRDFPVFLHPSTHEEHALARTERKTARGYRGFDVHCAPDVTLEDDLRRRDLTINAMARAPDGTLVDPWGGERDLRDGVLRHVGSAFAEDPVRILRVARFAARFERFEIASGTFALMRTMVAAGEADALVAERVWQEVSRGMMEARPSRMLAVLHATGALARIGPEIDRHWDERLARVVDAAASIGAPLAARFGALLHALAREAVESACARWRAPNDCRETALATCAEWRTIVHADVLDASATLALLERCDAIRKPERFGRVLAACDAIHRGDAGGAHRHLARLARALEAARGVDAGAIAASVARDADGAPLAERIKVAVRAAREAAVRTSLDATAG